MSGKGYEVGAVSTPSTPASPVLVHHTGDDLAESVTEARARLRDREILARLVAQQVGA